MILLPGSACKSGERWAVGGEFAAPPAGRPRLDLVANGLSDGVPLDVDFGDDAFYSDYTQMAGLVFPVS